MLTKSEWHHLVKVREQMKKIRSKSNLDQNIELASVQGISYGELQARRYLESVPKIDTKI